MWEYSHSDELYHYGVKGMRWGVRRNPEKAYRKASKKLNKLNKKMLKQEQKAVEASARADKYSTSHRMLKRKPEKVQEAINEARFQAAKLSKSAKKGENWYKAMDETFKGTSIKLSAEQREIGRDFVNRVITRTYGRY